VRVLLIPMNVLIVALASSYVTLSVLAPSYAAEVWMPYFLIVFCLAVTNLVLERRR